MPAQSIELIARSIRLFTRLEAASGILLLVALAAALAWANSPWAETYFRILEAPLAFGSGGFSFSTTLHHVINDALMAVFFFVVGLEIKRETVAGELAGLRRAAFPALAALGGMLAPALIYALCNAGHASLRGWGIPVATDIPFALGILALLGKRIPGPVKIFLMALAIIDDLGAVLVIAVFYSGRMDWVGLAEAAAFVAVLIAFNRAGMRRAWLYALPGAALWHFLQKAGVHGTIAGVITAWSIPARSRNPAPDSSEDSPLQRIVDALHPWTSFFILPLFALSNAGVRIAPEVLSGLASPAGIGIFLGLVVGKPLGIFTAVQAMLALGFPKLSGGVTWKHLLGAGMLGGIGFTMSIFIAGLAFGAGGELDAAKVSIFLASFASGLLGYVFLRLLPAESGAAEEETPMP